MFNKEELIFLAESVDSRKSGSTADLQNKGYMLVRLAQLIEKEDKEEDESPTEVSDE
jgi:hypothetical protein